MNKNNLLYLIFIGLLTFSNCSSDNTNNDNENDSLLVGTWNGTASTFNGQNFGIPDNSIVKFTSDYRTEFIYEGFQNNSQDVSEFGSWSKNGDILTINWDDADPGIESYILNIIELTETDLIWETVIDGEGILTETFDR